MASSGDERSRSADMERPGFGGPERRASPPLPGSDLALLETLVLEAPVAFAFYDTDLRYRRINRMLADINAVPMEAHIGRRPSEVLPPALGRAIENRLRQVLDNGEVVADDDFQATSPATGERAHYDSQWYPTRDADGRIIGVAVLVSDITERRRAEDALVRSNVRTVRLQQATSALSSALTVDDVRRVVRDLVRATAFAHDADIALGTGTPAVVDPLAPLLPDADAEPGTVALPLIVSGGRIGTLRLVVRDRRAEDLAEDPAFLGALAGQCAIAIERARLYERERGTAAALQRSLMPDSLPEVAGVELAAQFLPGSQDAEVGGDWYDVFALPDGRLVLVVGDVMGKGVGAAAGMGRLRSALRALALVSPEPAAVLTALDRVFVATEGPDQIATLVYLLVEPASRRVLVGGAGHLPLVVARAGRLPELVDAGSGSTPLGWPEPRAQRMLELGAGDLILGVTDGVVERRGADLDEGLSRLVDALAAPPPTLEGLVTDVIARMLGADEGRDDATLLALRFH